MNATVATSAHEGPKLHAAKRSQKKKFRRRNEQTSMLGIITKDK